MKIINNKFLKNKIDNFSSLFQNYMLKCQCVKRNKKDMSVQTTITSGLLRNLTHKNYIIKGKKTGYEIITSGTPKEASKKLTRSSRIT